MLYGTTVPGIYGSTLYTLYTLALVLVLLYIVLYYETTSILYVKYEYIKLKYVRGTRNTGRQDIYLYYILIPVYYRIY